MPDEPTGDPDGAQSRALTPEQLKSVGQSESLSTHEFGHFFGLEHVAESGHGNLVMSPKINGYCQGNERNLGRGDLTGMLELHGRR